MPTSKHGLPPQGSDSVTHRPDLHRDDAPNDYWEQIKQMGIDKRNDEKRRCGITVHEADKLPPHIHKLLRSTP